MRVLCCIASLLCVACTDFIPLGDVDDLSFDPSEAFGLVNLTGQTVRFRASDPSYCVLVHCVIDHTSPTWPYQVEAHSSEVVLFTDFLADREFDPLTEDFWVGWFTVKDGRITQRGGVAVEAGELESLNHLVVITELEEYHPPGSN